jgi:iron complex outermembrane recepter protein
MFSAWKPNNYNLFLTIICLGLTLSARTAHCSTTDTSDTHPTQSGATEPEKQACQLDDVVVRGDLSQKNLAATSSTVITREEITNRVYESPLGIVSLTPGVSVKQYKQGGTAASFQMRGFTSCSHGSDVAIYLDGIPLNEGDGYADTNIVNPEELERVEVIKGPISPLYGNYASAGVIHFYTVKEVEGQHIKLQYGSFNTHEENYLGGFTSEDGKTDHVYSLLNYHTDGYQDNGDWDKQNAAARITHRFTDDFTARISLRGFNSDWDAPGSELLIYGKSK